MTVTGAGDVLGALTQSAARLRGLVEPLDGAELRRPSYDDDWSIADVLSHLGSGAVIMQRGAEASLSPGAAPTDNQAIWDEWNAKSPGDKARDALVADRALVERFSSLTDDEQSRLQFPMGPMTIDFAAAVGLRLNEHALHTWDIEVMFDASATVPADAARFVVDNLGLIVQFAGKANGPLRTVHVRTDAPQRDFTLSLGGDSVSLEPCTDAHEPDIELPAEAFVRLVYGRLDPGHTPSSVHDSTHALGDLRAAFPGI